MHTDSRLSGIVPRDEVDWLVVEEAAFGWLREGRGLAMIWPRIPGPRIPGPQIHPASAS
jgi:hypothetical protein